MTVKKILSLLVAMVMALGCVSLPAMAEESTAVAKIGETTYATIEEALKALKTLTSEATLTLLTDVTITEKWDCRASIPPVPVTIDGGGHTIKLTGEIDDGYNHYSAFRFENSATVKNLTIDMSEAISVFQGRFRAISSKGDLKVDNCTFIGNGSANNTRAIIFGESAGAAIGEVEVSITNSKFTGWRRGVSDNEGGQDAKSVVVTGNTFTDAAVYISASDVITFTGNTVEDNYVNIKSYTKSENLVVNATGNTLTANGEGNNVNKIDVASKNVNAQKEFYIPPTGTLPAAYTSEVGGYVRIWGESYKLNAKESVKYELYSGETLMATTQLNNIGNIIDGDIPSLTWNFFYPESDDSYWTTTWAEGHPNVAAQPTKVVLYVDGTEVAQASVQMNGPDSLNHVIWEELGGVKAPELPTATVTELSEEELGENAPELTFALNFKADEVTKEQLDYYGNWYADYVLTINKDFTANADGSADGYLAGQYDAWSENWVSVPFEDVTLKAGTKLRVLKYALEDNLTDYTTPLKYADVYNGVKNFNCGIYFDEEYIAANPDLKVTLELRMYHPDESKNETYVIGKTYTFEAPKVELFKLHSTNVTLGNSLAINFIYEKSNFEGTDYLAEIKHTTATGVIEKEIPYTAWIENGDYIYIAYDGISAKQMGDIVEITICKTDGTAVSETETESLENYAINYFDYYKNDLSMALWKKAIADMLNYGAAAQTYFGYNADKLVNVAAADDVAKYASTEVNYAGEYKSGGEGAYATSLNLKNKIELIALFTGVTDDMTAKVEFTNHKKQKISYQAELRKNGVYHEVIVDKLVIADINQPVKVTVYKADGSEYAWIQDSINEYLGYIQTTKDADPLFEMASKFATSAYAALHAND